ncbi:hypothetical protein U0070_019911, partial [Myodes glareolus]
VGAVTEETEACDWWSLGAVLFELLTGKLSGYEGEGTVAQACDGSMVTVSSLQISLGSQPTRPRRCRVDSCASKL